jgi:hypothetical protein
VSPDREAAWADGTTQASWRRGRRVGRIWLAVGLVMLVGLIWYLSARNDHVSDLRASGVGAEG